MLMFVSTLVTVTAAFGTTAPDASRTSPMIVADSCCANALAGPRRISPDKLNKVTTAIIAGLRPCMVCPSRRRDDTRFMHACHGRLTVDFQPIARFNLQSAIGHLQFQGASMHDVRLACRSLLATPIVSIAAALSLALGMGANTAIFSLVSSVMLRTLPVADPQRLAIVTSGASANREWSYAIWDELRRRAQEFDGAIAWAMRRFSLAQRGEVLVAAGVLVSGDFFTVLGVPPLLGRTFTPADDTRGGGPDGAVAVISYAV